MRNCFADVCRIAVFADGSDEYRCHLDVGRGQVTVLILKHLQYPHDIAIALLGLFHTNIGIYTVQEHGRRDLSNIRVHKCVVKNGFSSHIGHSTINVLFSHRLKELKLFKSPARHDDCVYRLIRRTPKRSLKRLQSRDSSPQLRSQLSDLDGTTNVVMFQIPTVVQKNRHTCCQSCSMPIIHENFE